MQAFRGNFFAASLFTAYVLFESVLTGIIPAFENSITRREVHPDPLRRKISRFHSDFRIIADFIAHKRADPDYVSTDRTAFVHTDEVLKLMSLLTDDDRYELTLNSEGGKPKNMCEMLDRVEARGVEKGRAEGMAKGEDMIISLLRKLSPGSEDYYKALNASSEERRELYKKYGIA